MTPDPPIALCRLCHEPTDRCRHPHPGRTPKPTEDGRSIRTTIPSGVRDELGLERDERPDEIEWDPDRREVVYRFGGD